MTILLTISFIVILFLLQLCFLKMVDALNDLEGWVLTTMACLVFLVILSGISNGISTIEKVTYNDKIICINQNYYSVTESGNINKFPDNVTISDKFQVKTTMYYGNGSWPLSGTIMHSKVEHFITLDNSNIPKYTVGK